MEEIVYNVVGDIHLLMIAVIEIKGLCHHTTVDGKGGGAEVSPNQNPRVKNFSEMMTTELSQMKGDYN